MEPPPVQYVKTRDGLDIGYCVSGKGRPFVFMPWPASHLPLMWRSQFGRPLLEALAARFRLVQYDSRGQGVSTRGLPESLVFDDYLLDLEAVVERVGLDRFVLYGGPVSCHIAVQYAVKNPDRLDALILGDAGIDPATAPLMSLQLEEVARKDWELYLHLRASSFALQGAPVELSYWRESGNQEDTLRRSAAYRRSNVRDLLLLIEVPTLIINARKLTPDAPEFALAEQGRLIAALIPNARLILYDGFGSVLYSDGPEPPAAVLAIEEFLAGLPAYRGSVSTDHDSQTQRLSVREIEVLSLVVEGKTNRQIAEQLVISERTVINHLSHIFIKVGAENRAAAVAYALRHGLA